MKTIVSKFHGYLHTAEETDAYADLILRFFTTSFGNHNLYFAQFVFCGILNLLNVALQFLAIDVFLGHEFLARDRGLMGSSCLSVPLFC